MTGFARSARLLLPADFQRVMRKGKRVRNRLFTAIECAPGSTGPRLGLAVSKKNLRRAVDRNRFKRLVRESFRTTHSLPRCDVVVMATKNARDSLYSSLPQELEQYWSGLRTRWPAS